MNNLFLAAAIAVAALMLTETAHAQYFYIQGSTAYGFGFSRTLLGEQIDINAVSGRPTVRQGVYGSLGRGVVAGGSVGYMMTPFVGVELAGSYTLGAETDEFRPVAFSPLQAGLRSTLQTSIPAVTPSLVACFAEKGVVPYARLGLQIAFPAMTLTERADAVLQVAGAAGDSTKTYTGGLSIGVRYGMGLRVPLTGTMSLVGEAWMVSASWGPEQLEAQDGTVLVEYRETHRPSSAQSGEIRQEARTRFTLSTAGIGLGLFYRL